jgi:hypothetical protein
MRSAAALAIATARRRLAGTSMRVGAPYDWPLLVKQPVRPRRRSEVRIVEDDVRRLAAGSRVTRFTVGAALIGTRTPARVDPVNETASMPVQTPRRRWGRRRSGLKTWRHAGLVRISAKRIAFNGATSVGFSTMVQSAASAGATLQAIC